MWKSDHILSFFLTFLRKTMTTEEILKYGLMVFNNETDKFNRWLEKKNGYLEFPPKEMLETEENLKQVKQELDRIEYGIFN